jgi:exo-1,4-beta-D-glucosaminidase
LFVGLVSEVNVQTGDIRSQESMRKVSSTTKTRMRFFRLVVSLFFSIGAGQLSSSAAPESPRTIELAENWKLTSASNLQLGGAAISLPDYKDADWHAIRRMPATVLEILKEDGVYSNL